MRMGGYTTIFWLNWVIIFFTAVFGLGMGGYASIKVTALPRHLPTPAVFVTDLDSTPISA